MWNQELKELDTTAKYNMVVAKRFNLIYIPEERWKILLQVSHRSMTGHLKFDKLFLSLSYNPLDYNGKEHEGVHWQMQRLFKDEPYH